MSATPPPPPVGYHRKGPAPRPPRITIGTPLPYGSSLSTAQIPIPHTAQTIQGPAAPGWPSYVNPFQYMYSQKAGEFMTKGFEGVWDFTKSGMSFGEKFAFGLYDKVSKWSKKWFTHIFLFLVVFLYTVAGAVMFKAIEDPNSKQDFIASQEDQIKFFNDAKLLANKREILIGEPDEWDGNLVNLLRLHKSAVKSFIDTDRTLEQMKKFENPWTFWNSMFYCGTIYTTIGYGHIAPKTTLGRFLTIIYAIIGIPIFLILLADFGKLFTRGIKFIWAYVRRLYYTGTCRKVRKQQQVREVMRGINAVYDVAMRRPSQYVSPDIEVGRSPTDPGGVHSVREPDTPQSVSTHFATASNMGTPTTPYPETFEIDDEFNLPISLAIVILLLYIFFGAIIYVLWEDWSYFESFYFVFISMSTIGFGDFVPNHPIFMMCSIIYLVFGLALTSMCINVVQAKLHDSFAQASAKIGATIGLTLAEEESKRSLNVTPPNELASVHSAAKLEHILESDGEGSPEHLSTNEQQNRNLLTTHNNTNEDDAPPPLLPKKTQIVDKSEKKKKKFFNF